MRDEISAAVLFLARLIEKGEKFNHQQLEHFKSHLSRLLVERFKDHWFPDKPDKGQGYRCIRVNGLFHDPILKKAACASGMKYEDINLPYELTVWVDPNEVCCRFGETKGSFCTLASFNTKVLNSNHELCIKQSSATTTTSPSRIPLQLTEWERKGIQQQQGDSQYLSPYRGGGRTNNNSGKPWRGVENSPPRNYHGFNHYYQHWQNKSTLKV